VSNLTAGTTIDALSSDRRHTRCRKVTKGERKAMKTKIEFDHSSQFTRGTRIGLLLALITVFLCSFATSASAQWTETGSTSLAGIQIGTTQLWGIDSGGALYEYQTSTNSFQGICCPPYIPYSSITVGVGNSVWGLESDGQILQENAEGVFQYVAGSLTEIAAGGEGVWGVNGGQVYEWNGTRFVAPPHGQPNFYVASIYVGSNGIGPWALDSQGDAWLYNTDTDYFDESNGRNLTSIAVGNSYVWGITNSQGPNVWEYDVNTESWIQPDRFAILKQISAGSNSNIWGVNAAGQVYAFSQAEQQFELTAQPPESIRVVRASAGAAGVFALANSGHVYKWNP
jgi:virginiamycin B lyase